MDGIILSFQLFTRIPLKKEVEFSKKNLKIALYFLPIIGAIIGGFTGFIVKFFMEKSPIVAGAFGLLAYFFISGGLHLDGLSDMIDGFLSNSSKGRTLEIMKDSLIGTFGTLALIIYSILKFSLYASLQRDILFTLVWVSIISRCSAYWIILRGELARPGGFGSAMKDSIADDKGIYLIALIMGIAIIALLKKYAIVLIAITVVSEIINQISKRKIGGVTGDIYGANIEINEIVCLLILGGILWI